MFYYGNPTGEPAVHVAMADGVLGFIDTPLQGNVRPKGVRWCADNGCFGKGFQENRWWEWLKANDADGCAFATAPDVVGDAAATLERSLPWLSKIRGLGYPAAFVAQDGAEHVQIPWGEFDVLFVGGSTDFKLGAVARRLVHEAKARGLRVHMGRVNSLRRYRYAEAIGCDSADGTFLKFGPAKNLIRMLGWYRDLDNRPALFKMGGVA
jgi:hypothetical protein